LNQKIARLPIDNSQIINIKFLVGVITCLLLNKLQIYPVHVLLLCHRCVANSVSHYDEHLAIISSAITTDNGCVNPEQISNDYAKYLFIISYIECVLNFMFLP